MQKALMVCLSFLSQISAQALGADSAHLAELKSKFPLGLIGDDYGILTTEDLALNSCRLKPVPFVPGATRSFEYWICFESKNILPSCYDTRYTNEEGHLGWVYVDAHNSEMSYSFAEHRAWDIKDCRNFVKTLKKIMKGTSHACVSGSDITKEIKNKKSKYERSGFLHRFKTLKGCEGEECELTKEFKKEYCPQIQL